MVAGFGFYSLIVNVLFSLLLPNCGCSLVVAFQGSPQRASLHQQRQKRQEVIRRHASIQQDPLSFPPSFNKKKKTKKTKKLIDLSLPDESNTSFWREEQPTTNDNYVIIPNVPSLDATGALPLEAYRMAGKPKFEPKPTCLVSLAVDLHGVDSDADAAQDMVGNIQKLIDDGFTTFHLGLPTTSSRQSQQQISMDGGEDPLLSPSTMQTWGEEEIFGGLIRSTPGFALRTCHLVVPLQTPSGRNCPVSRSMVRQAVTESLQRIGADSIDTLQLRYCQDSPHHLDMLDCLMDLQRDGLIKSIAGQNFPVSVLAEAQNCGLALDSNQMDANLLQPKNYIQFIEQQQHTQFMRDQSMGKSQNVPLWLSNPLAGGLLTNRHGGQGVPPFPWEFSRAGYRSRVDWERAMSNLKLWRRRRQQRQEQQQSNNNDEILSRKTTIHHATSKREQLQRAKPRKRKLTTPEELAWNDYQTLVISAMTEMSRNYRVSVAAVALRWALQLNQVGSTVVGCNLMKQDNGGGKKSRASQLRDVFRFALEEDDMEELWKLSSIEPPQLCSEDDEDYPQLDIRELMGNCNLWL